MSRPKVRIAPQSPFGNTGLTNNIVLNGVAMSQNIDTIMGDTSKLIVFNEVGVCAISESIYFDPYSSTILGAASSVSIKCATHSSRPQILYKSNILDDVGGKV